MSTWNNSILLTDSVLTDRITQAARDMENVAGDFIAQTPDSIPLPVKLDLIKEAERLYLIDAVSKRTTRTSFKDMLWHLYDSLGTIHNHAPQVDWRGELRYCDCHQH